ncbi:MAG: hypothetical protein HC896_14360 [Bacteroidales bacterium]|nr:hypothetical protein [Bacteroidales bacterium]
MPRTSPIAAWKALRQKYPVLVFVASFVVLFFALYALLFSTHIAAFVHPKLIFVTALLSQQAINLLGQHTFLEQGSLIVSDKFTLSVIIDCCALEPMALFVAVALAYPARWKKKALGIVFFVGCAVLH